MQLEGFIAEVAEFRVPYEDPNDPDTFVIPPGRFSLVIVFRSTYRLRWTGMRLFDLESGEVFGLAN